MEHPFEVSVAPADWSKEALRMAAQARVLSGNKLEQLVVRLQRHSGRTKEACWRFVIQYGLKGKTDHRRWTEAEIDLVREELVKHSVDEVAKKLHRSPKSIRSMPLRQQLSVRSIRSDLFSVESLAVLLHVRKAAITGWIQRGWLPATLTNFGKRTSYNITPEALQHLHKHHRDDLLKQGMRNQTLFDAYVQHCYAPKHTVGEQLLDVRRDKRERAAFAATEEHNDRHEGEEDEYAEADHRHNIETEQFNAAGDSDF